ncbi:MAG: regulator of chromosome condensation RCC1 [Candidatus Magnetoglobus multicellularis str. Araruama]|uniref:Regulator of chromosome condensation RCC1 n=1 Tax=Candidatus Magnetoglobus multicellularis str. Araruama TaxID=890399 RepID=A0A1V1P2U4_9BACT|nr:MAG: regulator of chromosome condensation RCC1 [Candidatus Magnetoglobus multicellularis str. Araruama]
MKNNLSILLLILLFLIITSAKASTIKSKVVQIDAGFVFSIALKDDGTVWAWGSNSSGNLGDGTTIYRSNPVQVIELSNVISITAGSNHSLAIKNDGSVWSWGFNCSGQLGDGTNSDKKFPVKVPGLTNVCMIDAGIHYSLALKMDGTVWAWGSNSYGQLGDGSTQNSFSPIKVSELSNVIMLAAGACHAFALKDDGTVWAWGNNGSGRLGDGTKIHRSKPVQVVSLSNIIMFSANSFHSLALDIDGTVWAWGNNGSGRLGDGTTQNSYNPIPVPGLSNIVTITGGYAHSLALKNDGTVWVWGYNNHGQLGDGTHTTKNTPVQLPEFTNVKMLDCADFHSLALKDDCSVWAWGHNAFGQLGDGTTISKKRPVKVSYFSNMPPTVADKEISLHEDALIYILLKGNDPENKPLSYSFVSLPTHGRIQIDGDIATYTPHPNYFGMDRFTYKAMDSYYDSNIADVVLTIINTPDPPVAKSFTIQTNENVPYTIIFQEYDVDGDQLTCHIISQPQHGNISDSFPSLLYIPDDWYWGTDRFVYKLSDGSSESLTAIVTIEIKQATSYPLILETNTNYGLIVLNGESVLCPYSKTFAVNDRVTVEAISTDDHIFDGWTVNHQTFMENPKTITMTTCQIITVHFVPPKITAKFLGHESIKIDNQTYSLPFEKSYYKGSSLIVDALPHNRFIKWIGDITETQNPIEINCQSDITIGAIFTNPFEWTASLIAETTDLAQTYTDHIQIGVSILPQNEPYVFTDIYACRFISYGSDWQQYQKIFRLMTPMNSNG